ncbi:PAS domain S-box protein [Gilvimarinus sp. F26214L]|uniref:PAS domain S-box protein n=1 Tax=Gilvimarinus sp. DZF01 TaxID=3461371 RepID=UPI0040459617
MKLQPPDRLPPAADWITTRGEAAEQIASLDWSNTTLGAVEHWPQTLRAAVNLCLAMNTPGAVVWGAQRQFIFNEAFAELCSEPSGRWQLLGKPLEQCRHVWASTVDAFERALAGQSQNHTQRLYPLTDTGIEERFYTVNLTPLTGESGRVEGAFFAASDVTQTALSERRLYALKEFIANTADADSFDTIHHWFPAGLAGQTLDLPFALLYLLDSECSTATLAGATGLHDEALMPRIVELNDDDEVAWPLAVAVRSEKPVPVRDVMERLGAFSCGPFPEPIREAMVLPVDVAGPHAPSAVMVLGVNPRRPLDPGCENFFLLMRNAVKQVLTRASARAESRHWEATNLALLRSEERYRATVEGQAEMVCRFHPEGTIYFSNRAYARTFGSTPEALEGTSFWQFVSAEDRPAVRELLARLRPDNRQVQIENHLETDQGKRWTIWTSQALAFDKDGRPTEVQSVGMDITDRRRMEQALREREEQLRLALQGAQAGAWSIDVQSRVTFWSQEFLKLYGFAPDQRPSFRDWIDRVHPEDRQWVQQNFLSRPTTEAFEYQQEFRILHPELGERWLLALGRVDRDEHGDARKISGINIDITERKTVERALRESEERFRTLADNMSQLAWMADPNGWIFWYNSRWYEYTGSDLDNVRGWGWTRVLRPERAEQIAAAAREHWQSGEPWEHTFEVRSADGEYRWFLTRVTPIFRDGQLIRWFGTNTDITEQRTAEDALKEADRRKDEFLATLAHELRNPLAPLRNGLEVMRLAADNPQAMSEARAIMERQLAHMVHLINDLLDLSRISRGKVKLRKQVVPVSEVIDQAVESCRPLLEQAGHKLTVNLPSKAVFIDADPARMAQVFANLLNNASKFTGERGQIWITAEHSGETVLVRVRDTGIGIPPVLLDQVFDMFTQGDPVEQAQGGLGIGLSLVKGLVEMHGGTVEAHSPGVNLGSEFVVHLPAMTEPQEQALSTGDQSTEPDSRRHILVVDDNRDAASSMATMLELMGHETRTAHDGLEAVEAAGAFQPDLILLDLGMPRLNGYDAARRIRAQQWGRDILLVALTGWGQAEDRRRSQEAGFDAHLVKPVDLQALRELLNRTGSHNGK